MPDMTPADAFMEIFGFTRAENKEDLDMKRYNLYESEMIDDSEGKYVLHDDAQSEIARLRAENEKLRDENSQLKANLDEMRKLMDRKSPVKCGICGLYDCTADHDKPTYLR